MKEKLVVAVVGATGAVGREMLSTLYSRNFPATTIKALASSRSAGTKVPYGDDELVVEELTENSFEGVDIAIFSAGGGTSTEFAPHAVKSGCVVVDNSSAWRMDERCPLVIPEVNMPSKNTTALLRTPTAPPFKCLSPSNLSTM